MRNRSIILLVLSLIFVNGCAVVFQKGKSSDIQRIESLKGEINELNNAKVVLGQKLSQEIIDQQVRLDMVQKRIGYHFCGRDSL